MRRTVCKLGVTAAVLMLAASTHTISARASGSVGSTTGVILTANNVAYDSSAAANVLMIAQISGDDGGVPTGSVTFDDQNGALSSPITLSPAGTATFKLKYPAAGGHQIFATYSGDASYQPSSSQPQTLTVTAEPTTTVVTAVPSNPAPGVSVAIHASVSPAWAGTPTGSVTIYDASAHPLQTAALVSDQATLWTTAPTQPATSVSYYATYSGDGNFQSSSFGVQVTSTGTVVVTGSGSGTSGGGQGVFKTTGTATTTAGTTATTAPDNPTPVTTTSHVKVIPADTATAATSVIAATAKGSVLPSDVLDTAAVAPVEPPSLLGSAITFGQALVLGPYLIPVNVLLALGLIYAARRGRKLTAVALDSKPALRGAVSVQVAPDGVSLQGRPAKLGMDSATRGRLTFPV
jgi:Bacterial Ig-like domain (group 3)